MGFSRQEYWSGLSFPSPGDLPDPGIEPGSPALEADALTSEPPGKPSESEEELKNFLMKVKEKSEKVGLKLNIWKTKIMTSDPITSWQTEGEKVEAVTDFLFSGSKIIVDGDCSHEIKRCVLLEEKLLET